MLDDWTLLAPQPAR